MNKEFLIRFIGVFFVLIGIVAIINTVNKGNASSILWLCYISMFVVGVGFYRRDSGLVMSQLNIILIPLLFWNFDFFYRVIFSKTYFGIVDYFFVPGDIMGKLVASQHIFTLPLALFGVYLIGFKKGSLKLSFFSLIILFFITRIFTGPLDNVNCVFENCANFDLGFYYPLAWFITMFSSTLISFFLFNYIFKKIKK